MSRRSELKIHHLTRNLFDRTTNKLAAREKSLARRKSLRLEPRAESLEAKLVLTDPGMPITTLVKEHAAMAFLGQFESHHTTDALNLKMSDRNYFLVAQDFNTTDTASPLWADSNNWLKYTYNTTTSQYDVSQYGSVPRTGDDARIPAGLTMIYDVTPALLVQGDPLLILPKICVFIRLISKAR